MMSSRYLGTIIKQNFPQYSPRHHRWLVPFETLTTNLMVGYARFSQHGEKSSFCFDRQAFGYPSRKRNIVFEQSGDAMNINMIAVALAWFHACAGVQTPEQAQSPFIAAVGRVLVKHASEVSEDQEREQKDLNKKRRA